MPHGDVPQSEGPQHAESRRLRLLSLLAASAADLLQADDPLAMIDRLFEATRAELGLDVFFHYAFRGGGELLLEAYGGLTPAQAEAGARLPLGEGVCGTVARTRRPVVLWDIQHCTEPMCAIVQRLGLQAYACTPLLQGDALLGTLGFGRRSEVPFDEAEIRFLQTMCSYVAIAKHRILTEQELRAGLAERDRLLAEQKDAEEKMVELTRVIALGTVAATIAHELNQPLAAASNYVSAIRLARDPEPGKAADLAAACDTQLQRAGEIIRRLRRLVSHDGLVLEEGALEPMIDEAVKLVKAAVGGQLPRFRALVGPGAERGLVDHAHIVQVVGTLLREKVDTAAGAPDMLVTVETRRTSAGEIEFRIADDGADFDARLRAAMSDPRSAGSRGRFGLGYSIARNVLGAHGDTLRVEDKPGCGPIFCFTVSAPPER